MVDTSSDDRTLVVQVAQLLEEHLAEDTLVLKVRDICSWTDYFVIATVRSQAHLRGLVERIVPILRLSESPPRNRHRSASDQGWVLIDCGGFVIHLMDREKRDFYELEKLWWEGEEISYSSSSS